MLQLILKAKEMLSNSQNTKPFQTVIMIDCPQLTDEIDNELFRYDSITRQLSININPLLIMSIHENIKLELYQKILTLNQPILKLIKGPIMKGLLFQSIITQIFSIQKTQVKLKTHYLNGDHWNQTTLSMYFKTGKMYPFESIPKFSEKRFQNYCFLEAFRKSFASSKSGNWNLFMPLKNIPQVFSDVKSTQVDFFSKCIDFVVAGLVKSKYRLFLFDVTISPGQIAHKVNSFWQNYLLCFKDKWQRSIDESHQVEMEYFILMNHLKDTKSIRISNILKEVEPQLSAEYYFQEFQNTCQISHRNRMCLLKKISIISLDSLQFSNDNSSAFWIYSQMIDKLKIGSQNY